MSKYDRIKNIAVGIGLIILSILMFVFPDTGYYMAAVIFGVVLLLNGIKQMIYFLSMGIHMVGGKMILYRALITLDLGFFLLSISSIGQRYLMAYFMVYYFFVGIITIFRAYEARKIKAGLWKWKLMNGLIKVMIAITCIVNFNSEDMMLFLVCFAVIASALTRIGMALKKTAIIFIQ